jgi:TolB-like protein
MRGASEIFVSYKSEDRARLQPLVSALEAEGFLVWWDAHIGGGTNWQKDIEQHLDSARCVIVAWTKRSVGDQGHFVRDEARRAQRRGAYLPVCLDAVEPPLGFGEIQAIPLVKWKGDRADLRFQSLVDAIRAYQSGQHSVTPPISHEAPAFSRRALVGGGIGAAVVVGTGGWALLHSSGAAASNRIAVMNFNNMSGDPAQGYFSDGIAEELRGALSRVGLQVIGKASCDAVQGLGIPEAAAKLGVANILTGSVRRSSETIRIGAQLVSGHDGVEKWAQNYDRAPGDAIKIQTDIASEVAGALSIALGAANRAALTLGATADARAQDLYLQASSLSRKSDGPAESRQAIGLYDAAIALDPSYGNAHLGKAMALGGYGGRYSSGPAEMNQWFDRAEQSARMAASLMPGSATVSAFFATLSYYRLDFTTALIRFNQALRSEPDNTRVLGEALEFLPWVVGGTSPLGLADRRVTLDPLNQAAYGQRGVCLFTLRRYEDAIMACRKAQALAPQRSSPKNWILHSLILLGRLGEAKALLAQLPADDLFAQTDRAILSARSGDHAGATAILTKIGTAFGNSSSYQYAQVQAQLGNADKTFATLNKSLQARDPGLLYLKRDPFLDPIRSDPRYTAFLARLIFP